MTHISTEIPQMEHVTFSRDSWPVHVYKWYTRHLVRNN